MKSYTVLQYTMAGCSEMEHQSMLAVWAIMGGKVCDTGCHAFNGGECPSYKKLTAEVVKVKKLNQAEPNKLFTKNSTSFINACEAAGTKPTTRQASKFRRGKGIAYKTMMKRGKAVQP